MVKPFDVTKFRKNITKSIDGLGIGFNDPTDWISTGNHALNYLISGDFYKGIPLGKVTVFAGESGSGKSYICSGNIIREAQKQDILLGVISGGSYQTVQRRSSDLRKSCDSGVPIMISDPKSIQSETYQNISKTLLKYIEL